MVAHIISPLIVYALRHPFRVGIVWCATAAVFYAVGLGCAVALSGSLIASEARVATLSLQLAHHLIEKSSAGAPMHFETSVSDTLTRHAVVVWPSRVALGEE